MTYLRNRFRDFVCDVARNTDVSYARSERTVFAGLQSISLYSLRSTRKPLRVYGGNI